MTEGLSISTGTGAGLPASGTLSLNVTEFKKHCLAILRALEQRKLSHVTVTRRGRPVAELTAAEEVLRPSLWGAHRGSVEVVPGFDLTAPILDEPLDALAGPLHR